VTFYLLILLHNDLSHNVGKYLYEKKPANKVQNADPDDEELYSSKYLYEATDIQRNEFKWENLDPVLVIEHLTNEVPVSKNVDSVLRRAEEDLDIDVELPILDFNQIVALIVY